MTLREISVGRSKDSDIYLDENCIYASSNHGTIYCDGGQLMFRDTSSNGTVINNVLVKHQVVPINRGDIILAAGQYQISWYQIDMFFPPSELQQTPPRTVIGSPQMPLQTPMGTSVQSSMPQQTPLNLSKWNWGAFGLYPIWGFFNGCWWVFFVWLFLGWFFLIPNIVFGINGTKWAWQNRTWISVEDFTHTQAVWGTVAIILICIGLVSTFLVFIFYLTVFLGFLSSL